MSKFSALVFYLLIVKHRKPEVSRNNNDGGNFQNSEQFNKTFSVKGNVQKISNSTSSSNKIGCPNQSTKSTSLVEQSRIVQAQEGGAPHVLRRNEQPAVWISALLVCKINVLEMKTY